MSYNLGRAMTLTKQAVRVMMQGEAVLQACDQGARRSRAAGSPIGSKSSRATWARPRDMPLLCAPGDKAPVGAQKKGGFSVVQGGTTDAHDERGAGEVGSIEEDRGGRRAMEAAGGRRTCPAGTARIAFRPRSARPRSPNQ